MKSLNYRKIKCQELDEEALIQSALRCLEARVKYQAETMKNPQMITDYLRLQLGDEPHEIFGVVFLNHAHQLITFEKLFFGTINSTKIHPRIVVKKAIEHNAAAVIFAHNHPAGTMAPSKDDIQITNTLKKVLQVIDVRTLDHIIVSQKNAYSFAEHDLL